MSGNDITLLSIIGFGLIFKLTIDVLPSIINPLAELI